MIHHRPALCAMIHTEFRCARLLEELDRRLILVSCAMRCAAMAFPTSRRGVESITVLKPHSQEQQFNFPIFGTFLRFFFSFRAAGCDFHLQIIKHTPKRYLYLSLFYDDIFRFRSLIANFSPIPGLSLIHWFLFHFYKHIKLPQK